jgi:hypothetical protein
MKTCGKCKIEKDNNDFTENQFWCKSCVKEYGRVYRENNKERIKKVNDQYYKDNYNRIKLSHKRYKEKFKEIIREKDKKYRDKNKHIKKAYNEKNKEAINKYKQDWQKENKIKIRDNKNKLRLKNKQLGMVDPQFKLYSTISSNIRTYIKKCGGSKQGKPCFKYLSYSKEELKNHIEGLMEPWMTWQNHGLYNPATWNDDDSSTWTWQLDHIIPHSHFHYTSMDDDDFKKCWSLNNLRPYSAKQNIIDGDRRKPIE